MKITEDTIYAALKQVYDPELFINVVDLGLIYEVALTEESGKLNAAIKMTMTSPACPAAPQLVQDVKDALKELGDGIGNVDVEVVMSPPWTPDRMTEEARDELGMF